MWIEYPNLLAKLCADDTYGLQQIRVVGHYHCYIKSSHMGVVQEVRGQIHIRAFLFRLYHPRIGLALPRSDSKWHGNLVTEEVPEMDRYAGDCPQRTQIELLPHRLIRIIRPRADERGKVLYFANGVIRKQ